MSFYDNSILIQNIKKLMSDNGITQAKLADILGMSQSNVSKALSENDKKRFTLDQVAGIAKHFNTSIDRLMGNDNATLPGTSPRDIAAYISQLIENGDLVVFDHSVEEYVCDVEWDYKEGPSCTTGNKTTVYHAFYLPSYWQIPEDSTVSEAKKNELWYEMTQCGNTGKHFDTNKFIHQFLQIHAMYKQKGLEEETYRNVVEDFLNHLRDY